MNPPKLPDQLVCVGPVSAEKPANSKNSAPGAQREYKTVNTGHLILFSGKKWKIKLFQRLSPFPEVSSVLLVPPPSSWQKHQLCSFALSTSNTADHWHGLRKKLNLPFLSQSTSYIQLNVSKAFGLSECPIHKLQSQASLMCHSCLPNRYSAELPWGQRKTLLYFLAFRHRYLTSQLVCVSPTWLQAMGIKKILDLSSLTNIANAILKGCCITPRSICTHRLHVLFFSLPPANKYFDKEKKMHYVHPSI